MPKIPRQEITVHQGNYTHHTISTPKGELDHFVILPEENRGYFYEVGSLIIISHTNLDKLEYIVYPPGKWTKLEYRDYDTNKESKNA